MKSKKDMTQADWDKFYSEHPEAPADRFLLYRHKVLPHIMGIPRHILDVGCGTGDGLLEAQKLFPDALLYGLDYSGAAIRACRKRVARSCFYRIDITQDEPLTFRADLVMCVQTLEHFRPDQVPWVLARLFQATIRQLIVSVPYANCIADKDHKVRFNELSFAGLVPDFMLVEKPHMTVSWIRR